MDFKDIFNEILELNEIKNEKENWIDFEKRPEFIKLKKNFGVIFNKLSSENSNKMGGTALQHVMIKQILIPLLGSEQNFF